MPIRNPFGEDARNLGTFDDLADLQAQYPVGDDGWTAILDNGSSAADFAIWDPDPGVWRVITSGTPTGTVVYMGTWNADTNTPSLSSGGGGGNMGEYYVVSVAGTTLIDGIDVWDVGDWIIHNGSTWDKVDNSEPTDFSDLLFRILNSTDATKKIKFDAATISTGQTRTITMPDKDVTLDDAGDPRDPNAHDLAGAEHNADTLANLNSKISDATLDDVAGTRDPNAHAIASAAHSPSTLAQLNTKVSDATLDGTTDPRDPNAHALGGAAHSADTLANLNSKISDATLDGNTDARPPTAHAIGGAAHSIDTLANLNSRISDATLDDAGDTRTPSLHNLGGAEHGADTLANLNTKVSDATLDDAGDPRTPTAHAASHQNGGADEIATSTPAANVIPKADGGGTVDAFVSDASTTVKGKVELATDGETAAGLAVQSNDNRLVNSRPPTSHPIAGTAHSTSTLAELNLKVSDATLDDVTGTRDPNAHDIGGTAHNASTLAQLNGKISDATIDDSASARPPLGHGSSHKHGGSDEIASSTPAINTIPKTGVTDKLDGWISDGSTTVKGLVELATDGESGAGVAVQGNDARLSDDRNPNAHGSSHQHSGSDEIATATPAANAIPKANGSARLDSWISNATTAVKGLVELATDGESAANVAVQGNDARLSDSRDPNAHAATHTNGTDDIQDAGLAQKGLINTAAQALAGVKTFQSFPVGPSAAPTADYEFANKKYVDDLVAAGLILQGNWDANTNTPDISTTTTTGYAWRVSVAGSTNLGGITDWQVNDLAVKSATGWLKIDNSDTEAVWGNITGTLSDQTDLQGALDNKKDDFTENTGFNKNFGAIAGTVVEGNDSRLSDARTPLAHAASHTDGTDDIQDASQAQKGLLTAGIQGIGGRKDFDTPIRLETLNTGDNIIITDTDGDTLESGATIETAPSGGSGVTLVEYASAPVSPPAGFRWIQRVDANTVRTCYYDGTQTYYAVLTV